MAYGDSPVKQAGIKKEEEHFPILCKVFSGKIKLIPSSKKENTQLKVDYWGDDWDSDPLNFTKKYAFDFKTGEKPWEGFKMTFKLNNSNKNSFQVGRRDIITIFLLEHLESYALFPKEQIYQWILNHKPQIHPSFYDNSTFFFFPTSDLITLDPKIILYKNFIN